MVRFHFGGFSRVRAGGRTSRTRARGPSAVEAVADVAAGFGEELVVSYGDVDGFAVAGGFHDGGS